MDRLNRDFARAVTHFRAQRLHLAEKICRQILKKHPRHQSALKMRSLIALQQGAWLRARPLLEHLLKIDPDHAATLCNLGLACLELGDIDNALQYCRRAVTLAPQDADANNNLGRVYQLQGKMEQALDCYTMALQASPWNPYMQVNAGAVCQHLGQTEETVKYYHQALQIDPGFADAHNNLGVVLLDQGRYPQALQHFEQALQQRQSADLYNHIGLTHMAMEQFELARIAFARALKLEPGHQDALFNWAWFEEYHNNLELANQVSGRSRGKGTGHVGLLVLRSALARRKHDFAVALSVLETFDGGDQNTESDKILYLFEKAAVLDGLGRYTEAFTAFKQANETKNRWLKDDFDEVADTRLCDRLQAVFCAGNEQDGWQQLAASMSETKPQPRPLFIVGFPRSGTSLLAQVLGRHSRIQVAGEMPGILDLADGSAARILQSDRLYPDCLLDSSHPLTTENFQQLRDYYYKSLWHEAPSLQSAGAGDWLVDKMPHNAMHLGLIRLLFPDSPVIHISRHPLDACLSAYFANFEHHRYTANLQITARHYQRMMDLIGFYRQNLPLKLLEIRYQDLVTVPQDTLQPVLDFIGLPWENDCLTPERSTVHIKTRSYAQVRAAIHTGSVNRHRHYRFGLASVLPFVRPAIQHYGYEES